MYEGQQINICSMISSALLEENPGTTCLPTAKSTLTLLGWNFQAAQICSSKAGAKLFAIPINLKSVRCVFVKWSCSLSFPLVETDTVWQFVVIKRYNLERNQACKIFQVSPRNVKNPLSNYQEITLESPELSSGFQQLEGIALFTFLGENTNLGSLLLYWRFVLNSSRHLAVLQILHFGSSTGCVVHLLSFSLKLSFEEKYQHDLMLCGV